MDRQKREMREQKRQLKRLGNQRQRRLVRRQLAEDPDEAPHLETDFGRLSTAGMNGMDHDATRARAPKEDKAQSAPEDDLPGAE